MTVEHHGVVVDELPVALAAVDRRGGRTADRGAGRAERRFETDGRDMVAIGDIYQGGPVAKAEAELARAAGAEHVGRGEANVVLPVVLESRIARDDVSGRAKLPAVLIAQRESGAM